MNLQIGTQIKTLRKERGLTQEAVAEAVGVSYQAVSKWETGATTPDIGLLPSLASLFGVRIDRLFLVDRTDELARVDRVLYHERLTEDSFAYAKGVLESILKEEPGDADTLKRYAELLLKRINRDTLEARRMAEQALSASPEDVEAFSLYRRLCPGEREIVRSGNDTFLRVCKLYCNGEKQREMLAEAMMDMGDFSEAEEMIRAMETPCMGEIFRGELALAKGDRAGAAAIWLAIPEDDPKGQYEAGERLKALGRYEEAVACYRNAFRAESSPRDLSALYSLAFLLAGLDRAGEAADVWRTILETLASDHGITEGETAAWARRELAALEEKLK
ncbi:MAG: helix-turn-helix domain-containing protein [Clostridia bacterium]|nr:helix-turn-helix domain-containing protein [Clostridia bacterium]